MKSLILLFSLLMFIAAPMVWAVSPNASATPKASPLTTTQPTPSPSTEPLSSPSAENDAQVRQNIKDRIEKVIEEKATGENAALLKKRAVVGQIERVSMESFVVKTQGKQQQTIKYLPEKTAVLYLPKLTATPLSEVELNSEVVVMGFVDEDDVLEARRVLVSPEPLFPARKEVLWGTVENTTSAGVDLLLRDGTARTIPFGKKTRFQTASGEKAVKTDIKVEMTVLVTVLAPTEFDATPAASLVRMLK